MASQESIISSFFGLGSDSPKNWGGGPPGGSTGGGGGRFIIVDIGGGGGMRETLGVLMDGGGGMAVVGALFASGISWLGTFGPILSLSSDGLGNDKRMLEIKTTTKSKVATI